MPVPPKNKGESKEDYMSRLVSFNRKENKPQDQSVAIAGHESGVYKSEDKCPIHDDNCPDLCKWAKVNKSIEGLSNWIEKATSSWDVKQSKLKQHKMPKPKVPTTGIFSSKPKIKMPYTAESQMTLSLKDCDKEDELVVEEAMESPQSDSLNVKKALTTRSMHVMRPVGEYDPFGIYRSATTQTTRGFSKLQSPQGVAPLVGETMEEVGLRPLDIKPPWHHQAQKSCHAHGISYNPETGCYPCNLSKSLDCSKCGTSMVKQIGGTMACPKMHT